MIENLIFHKYIIPIFKISNKSHVIKEIICYNITYFNYTYRLNYNYNMETCLPQILHYYFMWLSKYII